MSAAEAARRLDVRMAEALGCEAEAREAEAEARAREVEAQLRGPLLAIPVGRDPGPLFRVSIGTLLLGFPMKLPMGRVQDLE